MDTAAPTMAPTVAQSKGSTEGVVFTIMFLVIIGVMVMMMKGLMHHAHQMLLPKWHEKDNDKWRKANGHSYDISIAFEVHPEEVPGDAGAIEAFRRKWSVKRVVQKLKAAGLDTKLFYSAEYDRVWLKVRASSLRLRDEAVRIKMSLLLEPTKLAAAAGKGKRNKTDDGWLWRPLKLEDSDENRKAGLYPPFEHVYAPYQSEKDLLYRHHNGSKGLLTSAARIKLLYSIIEGPKRAGCANIALDKLVTGKAIECHFALHDHHELSALQLKWLSLCALPHQQPYMEISHYFGEKIAFYYLYLGHYTKCLLYAAVMGIITHINMMAENYNPDAALVPYFCVAMVVWGAAFVDTWKREQSTYRLKWGTKGYEATEQDRQGFKGKLKASPVTGKPVMYYSGKARFPKIAAAQAVVATCTAAALAAVVGVFALKFWLTNPPMVSTYAVFGYPLGSITASLANAIQIQLMGDLYTTLAEKLTDWENHRTQTHYEDALIAKSFLFHLINSYAALFYIAFFKATFGESCVNDSCMEELRTTLGSIFITRLISGNFLEVGLPSLKMWWAARARRNNIAKKNAEAERYADLREMSCVEEQWELYEYGSRELFKDYLEMVIQFGYATLFAGAFPLAAVLSIVNNYVEIRVDGFRLSRQSRRARPASAEDIGTWQGVLNSMVYLSTMTNTGLLCFTCGFLGGEVSWAERLLAFIAIEHFMLALQYSVSLMIEDEAECVNVQHSRGEILVDKIMYDMGDDDGDSDSDDDAQMSAQQVTASLLQKHVSVDLSIYSTDEDFLTAAQKAQANYYKAPGAADKV